MAWQLNSEVSFKQLAVNTFLVSFGLLSDKLKVTDKGPWSVKGSHVIVKEWNPLVPFDTIAFKETSFWIQVHSLPPSCINMENAIAIGDRAGSFLQTDIKRSPGPHWKRFLRIKICVQVRDSLRCGFFFENTQRDTV